MPHAIDLRAEHRALAERLVATGRYESVADVVDQAMRLLDQHLGELQAEEDGLLALLEHEGEDGEDGTPAEEVFAGLRTRIAQAGKRQAAE